MLAPSVTFIFFNILVLAVEVTGLIDTFAVNNRNNCKQDPRIRVSSNENYEEHGTRLFHSNRRCYVAAGITLGLCLLQQPADASTREQLRVVYDPKTYSAVAFAPHDMSGAPKPLLVVLHGAGENDEDAWSLTNYRGEHAGLVPSLIATDTAPSELTENFVVVAPYSKGKRSFYEEPRGKLLDFVRWFCSEEGRKSGCPECDSHRIFLFGFSDGATVAVELATTRMFRAVVVAAYGFSGTLPKLALERLAGVPFWVFHSQDDVIFPVQYSDKLVASLRKYSHSSLIRYTRYEQDQEGFTGDVRGHSVGITASKLEELYSWMLSIV